MSDGRIVFSGGILASPITGVGGTFLTTLRRYLRLEQDQAMARLPPVLLLPDRVQPPELNGLDVVRVPSGRVRRNATLPRLLRRLHARLLHSPVAAIPWTRIPTIATIHDLPWHPDAGPDRFDPGHNWRHRLAVRIATRRAAAIIVPSQTTAGHLRACSPGRAPIHVIMHGVERPAEALELTRNGPFLVLGEDRPRKNLAMVRAAHARARQRCTDLPDLLIVGPGQTHGYVTEQEKNELLRRCRALLQLSKFEGFGMPVLEAFAHGAPVLCSDRGALREVVGAAALLADPDDLEAIAQALVRIHTDDALRRDLQVRGRQRAAELDVEHTARAWRALHQEILCGS